MSELKLSSMHIDALREISNIGTGNAVAALSKILNKKISMDVPKVKFLEFDEIASNIGGDDGILAAVLVNLNSQKVNGMMMFLIGYEQALAVANTMLSSMQGPKTELGDIEKSALTEIGNILNSSYLGALAGVIGETVGTSVPSFSIDMAGAILSVPAIAFGQVSDSVLFIESLFKADNVDISGYFILIPDVESFKYIFSKLGF